MIKNNEGKNDKIYFIFIGFLLSTRGLLNIINVIYLVDFIDE
jgi:hypothetical protein